ncbi:MAG: methionine adenosyltransferase [Candidatus Altiarchaeota archaeon]|nr:methionine adenosyltransferase [Candidatus Altiarchaeota archaeon]
MKIVKTAHPIYPEIEVVERKGIGHPDTLCDGISETISVELSKEYIKQHGTIHHHNVDKVMLVAGQSKPKWGGGQIIKPIYFLLAGRATNSVPVDRIAKKAAREYIKQIYPLATDDHLIINSKIGLGSNELIATVDRIKANDTSVGVGFAPFSKTEQLTLDISDLINSKSFRKEWPEVGTDTKVMAHNYKGKRDVTLAIAFVDRYLENIDAYKKSTSSVVELIEDRFGLDKGAVKLNFFDDFEKEMVYLTVLGTSAEQGDDGATGRGNRANGLITPARPMSLEASAGKNPVSHVGKLYNVLAQRIADEIFAQTHKPAEVIIQSRIGAPIVEPPFVMVRTDASEFEQIVRQETEKLSDITNDIVAGKVRLF